MSRFRDGLILASVTTAAVAACRRQIVPNIQLTARRWKEDPAKQLGKVALSGITGQGMFWSIGYDQIGLFQKPLVRMGFGQQVAEVIYEKLPASPAVPWIIKFMEIAADASKMPVEGALSRQHGVMPDVVASLLSQPFWSCVEAAEKLASAIAHPERVGQPESVKNSIGCIYGTGTRHVVSIGIYFAGKAIAARQAA